MKEEALINKILHYTVSSFLLVASFSQFASFVLFVKELICDVTDMKKATKLFIDILLYFFVVLKLPSAPHVGLPWLVEKRFLVNEAV